jgi:MYXO-CTERM domain-containing protein
MLMVTPGVPTVTATRASLFGELASATAPHIQFEDKEVEDPALGYTCSGSGFGIGCGAQPGSPEDATPSLPPSYQPPKPTTDGDAGIPDQPTSIGVYDVAVLAGANLDAVVGWLDDRGYAYDRGDIEALAPYVGEGWTVTTIRLNLAANLKNAAISPLSFTWEGSTPRLPVALSRQQDPALSVPLTVYVRAPGRWEFPDAWVPYAWDGPDGAWVTRNDLTLRLDRPASYDPIAYARQDIQYHQTLTLPREVRIPSRECAPETKKSRWGCGCFIGADTPLPVPLVAGPMVVLALVLRRTRRR